MIIVTSENDYNIIRLNGTRNTLEKTLLEYEQKYGVDNRKIVKVKCVGEFMDKLKNKTKNITNELYNIIGELNKVMQSLKGMINLVRIIELKIVIKRIIFENVLDYSLNCEKNPILWKKFLMKIANNRNNLYNRPESFIQHCSVKHFCNFS